MSDSRESHPIKPPLGKVLEYYEREQRLREFIEAQRTAGIVSDAHAREVTDACNDCHRELGLDESASRRAFRAEADTESMLVAQRQAYYILERSFLKLYPELTDAVKSLSDTLRQR